MASPFMANPVKETKAQKTERLKRAMNPWDVLSDIRCFAREGFDSIPPEWIGTYFRWWGVYTQGDGVGVVGGKDGQGRAFFFFSSRRRHTRLVSDWSQTCALPILSTVSWAPKAWSVSRKPACLAS